jgi:hypothetical protein
MSKLRSVLFATSPEVTSGKAAENCCAPNLGALTLKCFKNLFHRVSHNLTFPKNWHPCSSTRDLSPAFIVLVNSHAFAMLNALKKPSSDNLSCRIFKSCYFVGKAVIKLLDKRHDLDIDLSKILDKAAIIQCPARDNLDTVVVTVQILHL